MDTSFKKREISRKRRKFHNRKKIKGTDLVPRMNVNKSNKHLYVQLIDDENRTTLACVSTISKENKMKKSKDAAKKIGKEIAELAKKKKINAVIFDRGRFKYHGLIAELANAAREAGLQF
jgi:large subunit ribosomal protein L18